MPHTKSPPSPPPKTVVDFVIQRVRIRTNVCTLQAHEKGYTLPKRTVPDYNFIYCTRGKAVWVVNKIECPLSPGDLVLVPPHVQHHAHSLTRRVTLGSVHVEAILPGGQDMFALLVPPVLRSVKPGSLLDRYLRGAMHEFIRKDSSDRHTMLSSWGRLIVLELLRHDAAKNLLEYRPADPLVAAVLDELTKRSNQTLKLSELSKWSGYSPQHLNRVFRRVLGVTPLQHHAKLRVDHAAQLLRDEHRTIAAVAHELGFEDPYYFSRLFKQQMGMSPALFRQSATDQEFTPTGNR